MDIEHRQGREGLHPSRILEEHGQDSLPERAPGLAEQCHGQAEAKECSDVAPEDSPARQQIRNGVETYCDTSAAVEVLRGLEGVSHDSYQVAEHVPSGPLSPELDPGGNLVSRVVRDGASRSGKEPPLAIESQRELRARQRKHHAGHHPRDACVVDASDDLIADVVGFAVEAEQEAGVDRSTRSSVELVGSLRDREPRVEALVCCSERVLVRRLDPHQHELESCLAQQIHDFRVPGDIDRAGFGF